MPNTLSEKEHYERMDLPFYEEFIAPVLPLAVLDFHTHVWIPAHWKRIPWQERVPGSQYMVTDVDYSLEQLQSDGRRLFPDRPYKAVCFGNPTPSVDMEKANEYVGGACRFPNMFPLMIAGKGLARPEAIMQSLRDKGFLGYKVFLNWQGDNYADLRVEDMIGPAEMELAHTHRLIVLLHVPGAGRLADPQVQRGLRNLSRSYPEAQIVLAHCGRCYLPDEMNRAVGAIADLRNVSLDTSMVMEPQVLEMAFKAVGPQRVVFATDLPVARMRGRRVYAMDHWVDLVLEGYPASAYRVPSGNMHATFMVYEIVLAIRRAAEQVGLSESELRGVFHDNGMAVIERVRRPQ